MLARQEHDKSEILIVQKRPGILEGAGGVSWWKMSEDAENVFYPSCAKIG